MKPLELSHQALGADVASVILERKLFADACRPLPVLLFLRPKIADVKECFGTSQDMTKARAIRRRTHYLQ
jgi:hypothetical protein